jgi:hypothetical protein
MFGSFMGAEVEPLVASGFCPDNLYEGFRTYSREVFSSEKLAAIDGLLAKQKTDPHDTHPALTDRIAYARALPDSDVEQDSRPATSLLADAAATERKVSRHFAEKAGTSGRLESVAWREITERVYAPKLVEEGQVAVRKVSRAFACDANPGAAARTLVSRLLDGEPRGVAVLLESDLANAPGEVQDEVAPQLVARSLGVLLGAVMLERGGVWRSDIGKPHQVVIDGAVHEPFRTAADAVASRDQLIALGHELGGSAHGSSSANHGG